MTPEVQHSTTAPDGKKHYPRFSHLPDTLQGQSPADLQALFEETDGLPPDERLDILQLRGMTPQQCRIWELGSDFRGRLRYAVSIEWTAEQMWTEGGIRLPIGIERAGTVRPRSALPVERRRETAGKPAQSPKEPKKPPADTPPPKTVEQPVNAQEYVQYLAVAFLTAATGQTPEQVCDQLEIRTARRYEEWAAPYTNRVISTDMMRQMIRLVRDCLDPGTLQPLLPFFVKLRDTTDLHRPEEDGYAPGVFHAMRQWRLEDSLPENVERKKKRPGRGKRGGAQSPPASGATPQPKKPRGRPPGSGKKKKQPDPPSASAVAAPMAAEPQSFPAAAETPPVAAETSKPGIENLSPAAQFLVVRLLSECYFDGNSQDACACVSLDDGVYLRALLQCGDTTIAYADLREATTFLRRVLPDRFLYVKIQIGQWYADRSSLIQDSFQARVTQAIADEKSNAERAKAKTK